MGQASQPAFLLLRNLASESRCKTCKTAKLKTCHDDQCVSLTWKQELLGMMRISNHQGVNQPGGCCMQEQDTKGAQAGITKTALKREFQSGSKEEWQGTKCIDHFQTVFVYLFDLILAV